MDASELAQTLFSSGNSINQIREKLAAMQLDEDSIENILKPFKHAKYKKQRDLGMKLLAIGALLCFSSCMLTFFHAYNAMYTGFVLYGITSLGAILVLTGLGLILG